jgi:hypothetical protein
MPVPVVPAVTAQSVSSFLRATTASTVVTAATPVRSASVAPGPVRVNPARMARALMAARAARAVTALLPSATTGLRAGLAARADRAAMPQVMAPVARAEPVVPAEMVSSPDPVPSLATVLLAWRAVMAAPAARAEMRCRPMELVAQAAGAVTPVVAVRAVMVDLVRMQPV